MLRLRRGRIYHFHLGRTGKTDERLFFDRLMFKNDDFSFHRKPRPSLRLVATLLYLHVLTHEAHLLHLLGQRYTAVEVPHALGSICNKCRLRRVLLLLPVPVHKLLAHTLECRQHAPVTQTAIMNGQARVCVVRNQVRADGEQARLKVLDIPRQRRDELGQTAGDPEGQERVELDQVREQHERYRGQGYQPERRDGQLGQ